MALIKEDKHRSISVMRVYLSTPLPNPHTYFIVERKKYITAMITRMFVDIET